MQGIRGLEAEEVPLGPGLVEPVVGLAAPFPDGQAQSTVRELLLQVPEQVAHDHVRVVMVFPALEQEGTDAHPVAQFAGPPDLLPVEPEPGQIVVFLPATAEQAVPGTVVGKFQDPLEIDLPVKHEVHGLLGPPEQLGPEQRVFRQQELFIFLIREHGIFLQLIHQVHNVHPPFRFFTVLLL